MLKSRRWSQCLVALVLLLGLTILAAWQSRALYAQQPEPAAPPVQVAPPAQPKLPDPTAPPSTPEPAQAQTLPSLYVERAGAQAAYDLVQARQEAISPQIALADGASRLLREQLAASGLRRRDRQQLTFSLGRYQLAGALAKAQVAALDKQLGDLKARDVELEALITSTKAQAEARLAADEKLRREQELARAQEELKRKQEEERRKAALVAQEQAKRDAEQARERERAATTEEIKQLYAQQAKTHEHISALEAEKLELDKKLKAALEASSALFSTRKAEIKLLLERFPQPPSVNKARQDIDPKFEEVRRDYRAAIALYKASTRDLQSALRESRAQTEKLDALTKELEELDQDAKNGESELANAKRALWQTRLKSLELERALSSTRLEYARKRLEQADQKIAFYKQSREDLLVLASPDAAKRLYDVTRDENWQDALDAAQLGIARLVTHLQRRAMQLLELPTKLATVSFWSWLFGFLLRLGIIVIALRYLKREASSYVRKLTEALLKRKFFRARPSLAIKGSEVLRHLIVPAARFIALTVLIRYIAQVLPEVALLQLIVNAVYIFKLTTITVSVLFLPRALRGQSIEEMERFDVEALDQADGDVFKLEIDRARKLVRSAKVIIWFWLIVLYLPKLIIAFLGHSVIWRVVDLASKWFFVIVLYSVLTTWKDEIASLFERLAAERLPRAVTFVNSNKDRLWGVLVIAGASLYVVGRESTRLGREYLLEREWSKRISNFIFRKKIELQQRDQDKLAAEELAPKPELLPASYRAAFSTHCLLDEVYMIDRADQIAPIFKDIERWKNEHRLGSVALIGESGVGKTTLVNQLCARLQADEAFEITQATFFEKLTTIEATMDFICDLFGLPQDINDKATLVEALRQCKPRLLLLDDCHHLFMRKISGFSALEFFLEVVSLSDERHFWVLTFNRFAWYYLTRVRRREHFFGRVLTIEPWSEAQIQELVWTRNLVTGVSLSFTDLVVTHQASAGDDFSYEVVKSSRGYFRLLHEFCKGNPRVAMIYWLRSLKTCDDPETLQVVLFRQPPQRIAASLPDDYWFTLTALAQHGSLTPAEIAQSINAEHGFCEMAIDYFDQLGVVRLDARRRASLTPLHFRQVIRYLADSNYLYE